MFNNISNLSFIPVKNRSKIPLWHNWPDKAVGLSWFKDNPGHNVGVLLGDASGGIVDIDLDDHLAVRLAPSFLPKTEMRFGRISNPESHWIYRVSRSGETKRFSHGNHGTIAEYRSNGSQTVFPGSTHESGELIKFVIEGDPASVSRGELLEAVSKLSAATLLAINWNTGSRHDISLAVSGALIKSGWDTAEINDFVEAVCYAAGDQEAADRIKAVETTNERFARNETISGWPSLSELIGEGPSRKIAEWLGIEFDHGSSPSLVPNISDFASAPESQTDLGNAQRLADQHQHECFYHAEQGQWFVWNGCVWQPAIAGSIDMLAHETAKSIFDEAGTSPGLMLWAKDSCSKARLKAMVDIAVPYLSKSSVDLNQDPLLLNCQNGTLDLKTGELREHTRSDHMTELANVQFDPNATCPRFLQFIREVFEKDGELAYYMQSVLGYMLTGNTSEQQMFILFGSGANGKGTLTESIKSIMGSYAMNAQADTLMQKIKGVWF